MIMIGWQAAYAAGREFERRKQWAAAASFYKKALTFGQGTNPNLHHRLAHSNFQLNNVEKAIEHEEQAVRLKPNNATWHYKLGFYNERGKKFETALENYERAIELDPGMAAWYYRSYSCNAALNHRDNAENYLKKAISLDPSNVKYQRLLTASLRKSAPRWQELEALKSGLEFNEDNLEWQSRLAENYAILSRHQEAAHHFSRANSIDSTNPMMHYQEGYQWDLAGEQNKSSSAYGRAIEEDRTLGAKTHGIGVFHQKKERWVAATKAYSLQLAHNGSSSDAWYRYGFALDRSSNWADAAVAYANSISCDPTIPYRHYKLGYALERSQEWEKAAGAYLAAAGMAEGKSYWYYRAGHCLAKSGDYFEACKSYMKCNSIAASIDESAIDNLQVSKYLLDHTSSTRRRVLENCVGQTKSVMLESLGKEACAAAEWDIAEELFSEAIAHSDIHTPSYYFELGTAQFHQEKYSAAVESFKQSRTFQTPDGVNIDKYLKSKPLQKSMPFIEAMETLPISDEIVLWESNHGSSIGCHPLAIFRELLTRAEFSNFQHVWVINNGNPIPAELLNLRNVTFTTVHSDKYVRTLATAKYLVNNVSFPPYFIRREGQNYLNTWHGTPFKTLGKDMRGPILQHANLARNFLHSTHIMSPNEHTSWSLIDRHDISGIYEGKIEITGSPRLDRMINEETSLRKKLRLQLGIAESDLRPVVLFAPTWRGLTDDRSVDVDAIRRDLLALTGLEHHLVFRAHRLTEKLLEGIDLPTIVVPAQIDTSDLLAAIDILVTDYSSISFDFLPLNRPIIYFTPDIEEYSTERGLYLDTTEMPGNFCYSHEELTKELQRVIANPLGNSEEYLQARDKFASMEDGSAAERVIDFFFNDASPSPTKLDERKLLLFHQSMIPNGIATSFLNLVESLDPDKFRVILVVEPEIIKSNPGRLEIFNRLPDIVQVVGRVGVYAQRPHERQLAGEFQTNFEFLNSEQEEQYFNGFRREFRRIFGTCAFDAHIEFDGYSPTWCSLMSIGSAKTSKLIYLHNDMIEEWEMKYPDLAAVFGLYRRYDRCISVAAEVSTVNSAGISNHFGIEVERFTHSDNQINPSEVIRKSELDLDTDIEEWYSKAKNNFLAIGRMSPEKDHQKLIHAFSQFHDLNPDSNLTIIGDGPLRSDLESLIIELNAQNFIWLAGQRSNPYPALRLAGAFVLPSIHEGQPMVLFEAMILQKDILCTDMPGPKGMLKDGYGLVVENSMEGLRSGLQSLTEMSGKQRIFDSETFRVNARQSFIDLALLKSS